MGEAKQLVNTKVLGQVISRISNIHLSEQPDMVVVNFEQHYSSNNLSNRMKKRQYWMKQNNLWKIIYEGAA